MNNKKINIENIKTILKGINYPGFNRDIISFGMVKNISIEDSVINVLLQINSDNKGHLDQLENQIKNSQEKKLKIKLIKNGLPIF